MLARQASLRLPSLIWPLLLVLPAVAAALYPELSALLVYDRAAIQHGELWRLVTGHWVHFSTGHLVCDATVLAVGAWFIGRLGCRQFLAISALSALVIGLALLQWLPDLARYGGLSGLAMTSTVLTGLLCLRTGNHKRLGLGLLLLVVGRLLFDLPGGRFALLDLTNQGILPVPLSHAVGALCGLAGYLGFTRSATGLPMARPVRGESMSSLRSGRSAPDQA